MVHRHMSVFAIYRSRAALEAAVEALRAADFPDADISILFPDDEGGHTLAHEKHTKAPEGATTGGATGAVLGGAFGWLVGIGVLAVPGVGAIVAAGPLLAALAGVGVGGALGGLAGALVGAGIPEYEAKRYEGRLKEGGTLVSVHCNDGGCVKQAMTIFERTGGEDVAAAGESSEVVEEDYDDGLGPEDAGSSDESPFRRPPDGGSGTDHWSGV